MQNHLWAWAAGAGVAGLFLLRALLPARRGKFGRDNFDASAKKGGLIALILTPVLAMARQAALKYGTHLLQTQLRNHISRPEGTRPRA